MPTTRPTSITEILEAVVTSRLSDTYHILPGIVQAYYAATQEADVQIAVNDPRFDPDTDELTTEEWPIYPKVRVAWPRFSGFVIVGPLAKGDKVQLLFQDLDDSAFRTTGQPSDPPRTRRHGSNAVIALPWDFTDAGVASDGAVAGTMVIGKDGAVQQVRIDGTHISLGASASDFVALSSKVDNIISTLDNVFRSGWVVVPNDGGAALKAAYVAAFAAPPASVASTLVKSG